MSNWVDWRTRENTGLHFRAQLGHLVSYLVECMSALTNLISNKSGGSRGDNANRLRPAILDCTLDLLCSHRIYWFLHQSALRVD